MNHNISIIFLLYLIICISVCTAGTKLDINNSSLDEIKQIENMPSAAAENLYDYIIEKGGLKSIYELLDIKGIDLNLFNNIKDKIAVYPVKHDKLEYSQQVIRTIQELIDEENLPQNVVDYLEDMILNPININKLSFDDLIKIPNLPPQDASAIIRHLKTRGEIQSFRQLRGVRDLSNYGLLTVKKYVDYSDDSEMLNKPLSFNLKQKFTADNMTDASYRFINRFRINYENYQFGFLQEKDRAETIKDSLLKFSIEINDKLYFNKIVLGNFKISEGLGLAIDSTDGRDNDFFNDPGDIFSTRQLYRINGLFSDVTTTEEYGLFGAAVQKKINNFILYGYYSSDKKDGILNPDGSINYYYYSTLDDKNYNDKFTEKIVGGYAKYYLPLDIFLGSHIGFGGMRINYDKEFHPDWTNLFDTNSVTVTDADYLNSFKGKTRNIQNIDFQILWNRFGLFGELAHLANAGSAHNLGLRYDSNRGNYLFLWRNYNSLYDNPYARGFAEGYGRFDGTILSYDYKFKNVDLNNDNINDYYFISNAEMKSEAGYYIQANQVKLNKYLKITNAYYDNWDYFKYDSSSKNTYRTNNDRFQGEIEIQPFLNFAIRLKHKIQRKYIDIGESKTNESTIRLINKINRDSYLNLESRYSKNVNSSGVKIDGNYYGMDYDYKFSSRLSLKTSFYIWNSDGFQLWNIEDNSIDFMEGDGHKLLFILTNYLSDNLQLKINFKFKYTDYKQENNYSYYYPDGVLIRNYQYEENLVVLKTYLNWRF